MTTETKTILQENLNLATQSINQLVTLTVTLWGGEGTTGEPLGWIKNGYVPVFIGCLYLASSKQNHTTPDAKPHD